MHFLKGFLKTAEFSHNNQGLEFQTTQNEPYQAGAAQTAPTGIESYEPTGASPKLQKPKKNMASIAVAMGKFADAAFLDGTAPQSNAASTLATQAKWTFSDGSAVTDEMGYNPYKTAKSKFIPKKGKKR